MGGRSLNTFLTGRIDEVRFSDGARSSGEIAANAASLACPEPADALPAAAALAIASLRRIRRIR